MAFKDFAAGEILTAADVDDFLMRQTVMVFDDASARDTALSAVLTEGMTVYLKSDDQQYVYTGSVWELSAPEFIRDYPSNTPELAVESSGQVLMTTGGFAVPQWQHMPTHNYIINGAFDVWQRGDSFTNPNSVYTADRWRTSRNGSGATVTISQEANTAGDAESPFYFRFDQSVAGSGATFSNLENRIEDVRTLQGQTVTISFEAKSDSNRVLTPVIGQFFGFGGSSTVNTFGTGITTSTTWARYSQTITIPSISGKTIISPSYVSVYLNLPLNVVQTIDIRNVQLEAGSIATPFKRHAPSLALERKACRWYYQQIDGVGFTSFIPFLNGNIHGSTEFRGILTFDEMRTQPTIVAASAGTYSCMAGGSSVGVSSFAFGTIGTTTARVIANLSTSRTVGHGAYIFAEADFDSAFTLSAEL